MVFVLVADFQTHYYSALCLDQLNRTQERAHLLQEFREHAQIAASPKLSTVSTDASLWAAVNWGSGDAGSVNQSTANWTTTVPDHLAEGLLWSNVTAAHLVADPNNQSALVAPLMPTIAANATTLANGQSNILHNLTTAALNLIFNDLHGSEDGICRRETSLLFLLLMLGTVWMAVSLFNFNKTYVCLLHMHCSI